MTDKKCLTNEKLQEYLDGNLTGEESRQIKDHIASCLECKKNLANLKMVYTQANAFAKKQLSEKPDKKRINQLISDISKSSANDLKTEPKKSLKFLEFLTQNTGWFVIPAMALVFIWIFFPATRIENPQDELTKFNLSNNAVKIVFADENAFATRDAKEIKLAELKKIPENQQISLPADSIIIIESGKQTFQFSEKATFTFSKNNINLKHGKIECKLKGEHKDFQITTKFAGVLPLGTSFSLTMADWYCRINLKSGKLKVTSLNGQHRILKTKQIIYVDKNGKFLTDLEQSEVNQLNQTRSQPFSGSSNQQSEPSATSSSSPDQLIDSF